MRFIKESSLIILLTLSCVGCRGLNRLLGQDDGVRQPDPTVISSLPPLGNAPDFAGAAAPAGFTRKTYFGVMPVSATVTFAKPKAGSYAAVYMQFRVLQSWMEVTQNANGGGIFNADTDLSVASVHYRQNPSGMAYCIFVYEPN